MINIAALKAGIVTNIYTYEDIDEATKFYEMGAFGDSDGFAEFPKGLNVKIGYRHKGGNFISPQEGEIEASEPEEPDLNDILQAEILLNQMELKESVSAIEQGNAEILLMMAEGGLL